MWQSVFLNIAPYGGEWVHINVCTIKRLRRHDVFPFEYAEDAAAFSQKLLDVTLEWQFKKHIQALSINPTT